MLGTGGKEQCGPPEGQCNVMQALAGGQGGAGDERAKRQLDVYDIICWSRAAINLKNELSVDLFNFGLPFGQTDFAGLLQPVGKTFNSIPGAFDRPQIPGINKNCSKIQEHLETLMEGGIQRQIYFSAKMF